MNFVFIITEIVEDEFQAIKSSPGFNFLSDREKRVSERFLHCLDCVFIIVDKIE